MTFGNSVIKIPILSKESLHRVAESAIVWIIDKLQDDIGHNYKIALKEN